jgi:hypothetical protein
MTYESMYERILTSDNLMFSPYEPNGNKKQSNKMQGNKIGTNKKHIHADEICRLALC